MNLHRNAALSLKGRRELCRRVVGGERTVIEAAEAAAISVRCARKWVARYRAEGESGLLDRSSAPHRIPHRTSEPRVQAIAALRRLRFTGPEIAECLEMALSTRVLGRLVGGAGHASDREDACPVRPGADPPTRGRSNAHERVRVERNDLPGKVQVGGAAEQEVDLLLPVELVVVLGIRVA